MSKKHPGFEAVANSVAKRQGVSVKTADKEIGAAKAHASTKAKKANPNLRNLSNGKRAPLHGGPKA